MAKKQPEANLMLPLNKIIEWPDNPRRTRIDGDINQIAASLIAQGQLLPLLVFPAAGADGLYWAIEGETRRLAFNRNVDAGKAEPDMMIKVEVLDAATSPSQLIAIALATNTVRHQMNPIDEMKAYRAMALAGMKPRMIGDLFNLSGREVNQRLALGDLIEPAADLIASSQRSIRWGQAMTMASPAQQERIVAEIRANPNAYMTMEEVRAELTRGNIPVESALFPASELSDCLVTDLFTQESGGFFSDADAFWKRQMVEIDRIVDEHRATHKDVKFFDRERFNEAGWAKDGDPAVSTAVIIAHEDGSVEIKTGMVPPAYLSNETDEGDEGSFLDGAQEAFAEEHENSDAAPTAKVEVNPLDNAQKSTTDYLTAQVIAGLKLKAASDHRIAMAFVIAQTLTRHGGLASSMAINGIGIDSKEQTSDVFIALENRRLARDRIAGEAGLFGVTSPAKVVALLLDLPDQPLHDLFAWTVAESIATPLTEATFEVFDAVGAEVMAGWKIEEAYLSTLTSGQIRALANEVVDIASLPSRNASIGIVKKAIMEAVEADALQGNWVGTLPSWMPPQITKLRDAVAARLDAEAAAAAAAVADDTQPLAAAA